MFKKTITLYGTEARILRVRAFALDVSIIELAEAIGYPPTRVSKVLNDLEQSAPMLAEITTYLDQREEQYVAVHEAQLA